MITKIAIVILTLLNGGWMLFDGIHVLRKGKYFGPERPGPWSGLLSAIGIDPFKLGPVFIMIGTLWLISAVGIVANQQWGLTFALIAAIATLWYLPVGTVISAAVIALIMFG